MGGRGEGKFETAVFCNPPAPPKSSSVFVGGGGGEGFKASVFCNAPAPESSVVGDGFKASVFCNPPEPESPVFVGVGGSGAPSPSSPWSSLGSSVINGQESLVVEAMAVTSQPATTAELVVVQPADSEPVQETK